MLFGSPEAARQLGYMIIVDSFQLKYFKFLICGNCCYAIYPQLQIRFLTQEEKQA